MCRRRHIRLRFRMWHIQRRKGTTVPARTEVCVHKSHGARQFSILEAILTGLRFRVCCDPPKAGRRRINDNGGGARSKEVRTYTRGGARHNKMAKACRRFTAGERATSSHGRKNYRRQCVSGRTMGCVQGRTPRIKCTGKTKGKPKTYIRDLSLLAAPTTSGGNGVGGGGRGAGAGVASLVPALVNRAVHQCKRRNPEAWAQAKLQ